MTSVLLVSPLLPLFWTFDDIYLEFQNRGRSPRLHGLSAMCNRFLRFTSDATPADLLNASMAAKAFRSKYLYTYTQTLMDLNSGLSVGHRVRPNRLSQYCYCHTGNLHLKFTDGGNGGPGGSVSFTCGFEDDFCGMRHVSTFQLKESFSRCKKQSCIPRN